MQGSVGSVIEMEGISWIVLEKGNGILCASKEVGKKATFSEVFQQGAAKGWAMLSISDYKRFRFLLCSEEDWWLSDQSGDGSIAFVGHGGSMGWSSAVAFYGARYLARFAEKKGEKEK